MVCTLIGDTYRMRVDYNLTQDQVLRASRHTWNGICLKEGIRPEFVNLAGVDEQVVEVKLYHFSQSVCISYARMYFTGLALHSADYWVLCCLVREFPVVRTFGHVVGLGSVFRRPSRVNLPTDSREWWFPYSEREDGNSEYSMTLCELADCLVGKVVYPTFTIIT